MEHKSHQHIGKLDGPQMIKNWFFFAVPSKRTKPFLRFKPNYTSLFETLLSHNLVLRTQSLEGKAINFTTSKAATISKPAGTETFSFELKKVNRTKSD